jgi:hypothetical protein
LVQSANLPGVALLNGGNPFTGGNQTVIGGSVGIGTTTPGKALEVAGSASGVPSGGSADPSVLFRVLNTATDGSESSSDVAGIGFGHNSTREAIVGASYGYDFLDFYVAGVLTSPAMRILGNGNIGIGTNAPSVALQVVGQIESAGPIAGLYFLDQNNNADVWAWLATSGRASLYNGAYGGKPLTVQTNGYVGIGTATPAPPGRAWLWKTPPAAVTSMI